jgi:outer membrane protein OmpA-like peptidoglycan-associated protein
MSKTSLAILPILALGAAGVGLTGCMTPRIKPAPSPAVVEARAHAAQARAHPAGLCAGVSLDPAVPLAVPFGYEKDELTEAGRGALDDAAAWLICRPAAVAAVTGEADPTGTEETRKAIAARRVVAVRAYLAAHGVAASRLLAAPPASGEVLSVIARGRGW